MYSYYYKLRCLILYYYISCHPLLCSAWWSHRHLRRCSCALPGRCARLLLYLKIQDLRHLEDYETLQATARDRFPFQISFSHRRRSTSLPHAPRSLQIFSSRTVPSSASRTCSCSASCNMRTCLVSESHNQLNRVFYTTCPLSQDFFAASLFRRSLMRKS